MKYRRYMPEDRAALVALWQQVFPDDPPHNEPTRALDAKLAHDDLVFVAEDNGSIVGACMAGYDGHRGWLYALAVDPRRRRRGIGQGLVGVVMQALKQLGCIKLNLQIRADNHAVADFYRALGFDLEERLSMGRFIE